MVRDLPAQAKVQKHTDEYVAKVEELLAKLLGFHVPPPDDAMAHQDAALEDHALMLASLGKVERRRLMPAQRRQGREGRHRR